MKKNFKNVVSTILIISAVLMSPNFSGLNFAQAAGPLTVDLGAASNFSILAETAITTTGATLITGNIGISPSAAAAITGFGLVMDPSNKFSTSALINGKIYASDYGASTPAYLTVATGDMLAAYNDAAGRAFPTATEIDAGILSSTTPDFIPGIYKWSTGVTITDQITLNGGASDVWIFQIAGDLDLAAAGSVATGTKILLTGGAQASNVFWQVGGLTGATLGTYSTFEGNILSAKQIRLRTGAVLNGRALAQTQVTLDANTVSSSPAYLHIIKLVVNDVNGTAVPANFNLYVKKLGVDTLGSPLLGTSTPGSLYTLDPGTYVVSEDANSSYTRTFSGDCDSSGNVTLLAGDNKTCTVINTSIPVPVVSSGGGSSPSPILPIVGLTKIPSTFFLSTAGLVTYNYTVSNVGKQQAITSVKLVDDKCAPVTYISGDINQNYKIEAAEIWKYSCTSTLYNTTTNTAVATAKSDDPYQQTTTATAIATVVVGNTVASSTPVVISAPTSTTSLVAPLISVIKTPSRLTPFPFGGGNVVYTYTVTNPGVVAMTNVSVSDDKCGPVKYISGDINKNNSLNVGEKWVYTCQTRISVSTKNTAIAKGSANGYTATSSAVATVLVLVPGMPNTGAGSVSQNVLVNSLPIIVALGFFLSLSFIFIKRKSS